MGLGHALRPRPTEEGVSQPRLPSLGRLPPRGGGLRERCSDLMGGTYAALELRTNDCEGRNAPQLEDEGWARGVREEAGPGAGGGSHPRSK